MSYKSEGDNFRMTKGLTRQDIAKLIRVGLKRMQKEGTLPAFKISVRTHSYSMGGDINVTITGVPSGFQIQNPARLAYVRQNPHSWHNDLSRNDPAFPAYTPEAQAALDAITALVGSYNFDDSDTMTDYFHVRFYSDTRFAWELERDEREAEANAARNAA